MLLDRHDGSSVSSKLYHSLNNYRITNNPTKTTMQDHKSWGRNNPKSWAEFSKAKEKNHDLTYEEFINNQNNQREHEL